MCVCAAKDVNSLEDLLGLDEEPPAPVTFGEVTLGGGGSLTSMPSTSFPVFGKPPAPPPQGHAHTHLNTQGGANATASGSTKPNEQQGDSSKAPNLKGVDPFDLFK